MRFANWKIVVGLGVFALGGLEAAFPSDDDARQLMLEEARKASTIFLGQVRNDMVRELERSGPIRSISVCKYSAPEAASSVSRQSGMRVARVSLRPRNRALGEPDVWEQQALLDFEKRISRGEKVEQMEISEIVSEPAGRFFRYIKAIPMGQACLPCHGPAASLSEGVKSQLASEYPHDRALNYEVGQVRGGISVKKPL